MSLWRQAGLSYLKYSEIAAQTLRKCVKVSFIHDFKSFCFLSNFLQFRINFLHYSLNDY